MGVLDHVTLDVGDLTASRRFHAAAPAALDAGEFSSDGAFAYGPKGSQDLWIRQGPASAPVHIALVAPSRDPGLRPRYHPSCCNAFVLDPDGHNIEAVDHGAASE